MFHVADERLALTSSLNKPHEPQGVHVGNITGTVTLLTMVRVGWHDTVDDEQRQYTDDEMDCK